MSDLWLGILISIPVGIAVNVLTPYLSRAVDRRNEKATGQRAARDEQFRVEAKVLAKDRTALYTYLLETLIRVAYIGALFGVLSGFLFFGAQAVNAPLVISGGYLRMRILSVATIAMSALGQLVALIGTLIVLNIARPAVQMIREVRSVSNRPAPSTSRS